MLLEAGTASNRGTYPWAAIARGGMMIVAAGALSFAGGTSSGQLARPDARVTCWTSGGASERVRVQGACSTWDAGGRGVAWEPRGDPPGPDTASLITELRNRSGLTWEQVASIFQVERRSVHFWASGRAMNASNAERLGRVMAALDRMDQGDPSLTRAFLLAPTVSGRIPLDLLREDELDELLTSDRSVRAASGHAPAIAVDEGAARSPRPPHQLMGADREISVASPGKVIRSKRLPRRTT